MKHYFYFKQENSLIAHQGLVYDKNDFVLEVIFKVTVKKPG